MAKTLAEFRAQNLHVLQQLCPDDPDFVSHWIKAFDKRHGIAAKASQSASRPAPSPASARKAPRSTRTTRSPGS